MEESRRGGGGRGGKEGVGDRVSYVGDKTLAMVGVVTVVSP